MTKLHDMFVLFSSLMFVTLLAGVVNRTNANDIYKGILSLDELTFDKVVSRFHYALVKFDHPYPYGVEHENFVRFGKQLAAHKYADIVAVNLEVKDYGDRDSLALALRYNVNKDQFPAIRLFINSHLDKTDLRLLHDTQTSIENFILLKPIVYPEIRNTTTNQIIFDPVHMRLWVWNQTGIRTTLTNCTEDLDQLAEQFLDYLDQQNINNKNYDNAEQQQEKEIRSKLQTIIDKVEKMSKKSSTQKRKTAQIYHRYMKRGLERGALFYDSEHQRISNLLSQDRQSSNKITDTKKEELRVHYNVLQSFRIKHYYQTKKSSPLAASSKSTAKPSIDGDDGIKVEL